ncbi:hypothetical protein [Altericroceibacterium xinjiangense]|uniref:hypothetical protein n=1 Tax=Altericroceibacterium xinjiangense TaxID=762261 RepID=UPI000F7DCADD|nr:hypothetical protein [Altericroceibacterium xinjiangense]
MPISRKNVVRGFLALILILAAACCANVLYQTRPRQIIGSLLRLESVPASLRNAECESWGFTDVLTTCAFEIDPADFPALLTGWSFTRTAAEGGSYHFSTGLKVGPEFPVATQFSILNPPAFPHGGQVLLVADAAKSRAQIDYYEE